MPKVSIIIPCYNLGLYLDEAVESCLSQTWEDSEILVIDDGSIDPGTRSLLSNYLRPRTQVLRTPNRGLARARNLGAQRTSGKYLCFLDADDRLHPDFFERALDQLESDPSLAFASCWIEAFGDETWVYQPERCDLEAVLADCTVATAALVRREAFLAAGGFDESMPAQGDEDWDLWISLLTRGFRGSIIPDILFQYRRRRGSMVDDCYYGEAHLTLMDYLFRKYSRHYRKHASSILALKELEVADHLSNGLKLQQKLNRHLLPAVAEMQLRPTSPQRTSHNIDFSKNAVEALEAAHGHIHHLTISLEKLRGELKGWRNSLSWRITAPLRALARLLLHPSPHSILRPRYHKKMMLKERQLLDLRIWTRDMEHKRVSLESELRFYDAQLSQTDQ